MLDAESSIVKLEDSVSVKKLPNEQFKDAVPEAVGKLIGRPVTEPVI
jgi:hypothetical protein